MLRSHLPATYIGQTVFRRTLSPLETCQIGAQIVVSQPGVYGLGGWIVRCEVATSNKGEWKVGEVYVITASELEDEDVVVVRNA
jgi:hypothetical protein